MEILKIIGAILLVIFTILSIKMLIDNFHNWLIIRQDKEHAKMVQLCREEQERNRE